MGNFFFKKLLHFFIIFWLWVKIYYFAGRNSAGLSKPKFSVRRIFRRSGDIFLKMLSEMHSTCPVELSRGLFWKNCNFTKILDFEHFFFGVSSKNSGSIVQTVIYVSSETFWKKMLRRPEVFWSSSNLEKGTLGFLTENFQHGCQNSFFLLCISHLFFWPSVIFLYTFAEKAFRNWNQSVHRIMRCPDDFSLIAMSKLHSACPVEPTGGHFLSERVAISLFFVVRVQCFRHIVKKFWQRCRKWHLQVLRNKLKKKSTSLYLKKFDHHPTWWINSLAFWPKTSSRAAEGVFLQVKWNNLRKYCFSKQKCNFPSFFFYFESIFMRLLLNFLAGLSKLNFECPQKYSTSWWFFFRERCRNCFQFLQWNFRRHFLLKNCVFITFLDFEQFILAFRQKNSASFSKLHSTYPMELLEESFSEWTAFSQDSWTLSTFFSAFSRKIPPALSKLSSTCPKKHFAEDKCVEWPQIFWSSSY